MKTLGGNHSLVLVLSVRLVRIKKHSHSETCAEEGGEPRLRGLLAALPQSTLLSCLVKLSNSNGLCPGGSSPRYGCIETLSPMHPPGGHMLRGTEQSCSSLSG